MIDKRTMHEESIRIPLPARLPGSIRPGTVVDQMVLGTDLAPAIIELCGASPLPGTHGKSFAPLLSGRSDAW